MSRFFEMVTGLLSWGTIILMVVLSAKTPAFVAIFIILFDIYWLLKSIYLSMHLRATYRLMKANMKVDWLQKLKQEGRSWEDIWHLVLFPMYNEPYEVVKDSFETLARSNYPKDKFIVVLATEEKAGAIAQETAHRIEAEFKNKFHKFVVTIHPQNLPGEIPGKGSNETWAAQRVKEDVVDVLKIPYEKIMVSVFDVDTQIYPEYFGRLTHAFINAPNRLRAIYQPVPLFFNNIYDTPAFARVVSFSSTFWQMMQQSRPERLTSFSSQSLPFQVVLDIGYWHKDIVSEDSRVFWQGYLRYQGDFRVEPLLYPVSMDANSAPTFWETMKNVYKQHRRWGWGVENIPYMLNGFRKDKKIPLRKKLYWSFHTIEGFHSWGTNALLVFALGWLPLFLGDANFNATMLSYNLPRITRTLLQISTVGIATSAILSVLLLSPKPKWFRKWHYLLYIAQWALIPITLIFFGAIPGLEAQTRLMLGGKWRLGFWVTPKGRYSKTAAEGRAV